MPTSLLSKAWRHANDARESVEGEFGRLAMARVAVQASSNFCRALWLLVLSHFFSSLVEPQAVALRRTLLTEWLTKTCLERKSTAHPRMRERRKMGQRRKMRQRHMRRRSGSAWLLLDSAWSVWNCWVWDNLRHLLIMFNNVQAWHSSRRYSQ